MKRIESPTNLRIRRVKNIRNGRNRDFWFLEGEKLIHEAIQSRLRIAEIFVTEEASQTHKRQLELLERKGAEIFLIGKRLMQAISDVETPPGMIAVSPRTAAAKTELPERFGALLLSVRDPGNFGTIIRAAEAAGCEFLAYTHDCTDPHQPKVIRSSMGSIFRVHLMEVSEPQRFLEQMKNEGVRFYALSPRRGTSLFTLTPKFPALILIGSESKGLPAELPAHEKISIPMKGQMESLNVAMAATLCFFQFSGIQE